MLFFVGLSTDKITFTMKYKIWIIVVAISLFIFTQSCEKNNVEMIGDEELFDEINGDGFTFFQNGDILTPDPVSPHGKLKLRYNDLVKNTLNSSGDIPSGTSLPNGSLIVKEVYNSNGDLLLYAAIKKDPSNSNSAEGWLWAEYALDGAPLVSITQKGSGCTSCHSSTPNNDHVKSFALR